MYATLVLVAGDFSFYRNNIPWEGWGCAVLVAVTLRGRVLFPAVFE